MLEDTQCLHYCRRFQQDFRVRVFSGKGRTRVRGPAVTLQAVAYLCSIKNADSSAFGVAKRSERSPVRAVVRA